MQDFLKTTAVKKKGDCYYSRPGDVPPLDLPPVTSRVAAVAMAPVSAGVGSFSPQMRARVAWIFFSNPAISLRLAATSACSASISATMARCVAREGRGDRYSLNDTLIDFRHAPRSSYSVPGQVVANWFALQRNQQVPSEDFLFVCSNPDHEVGIDEIIVINIE